MPWRFVLTSRLALLLLLCLPVMLGGCAYRSGGLYPESIRSVAVPVFDNRTFYVEQRPEGELTEALVKAIESRTPYVVLGSDVADSELRGTITGIEQSNRLRQRNTGLPEEVEVAITVDFQWTRLRDGAIIAEARGLQGFGRYVPTRGVSQPYDNAQHEAVERLVRLILGRMQGPW